MEPKEMTMDSDTATRQATPPAPQAARKPASFAWMRGAMPGVAQRIAELRQQWGDEHVTHCMRQGLTGVPGWFFAREGVIAVGTPWDDDPVMANFAALQISATQVLVCMRRPAAATPASAAPGGAAP
jgi:hypothetical protein